MTDEYCRCGECDYCIADEIQAWHDMEMLDGFPDEEELHD